MAFTPVQKLSIGTGAALGLLALVGLISWTSITQMIGSERAVMATNANVGRLDRIVTRTIDAENAQRGFVTTGDSAYLEPLSDAKNDVEFALDTLRTETEDNPEQRRNLERLAPLIARRFREIQAAVTARQRFGRDSAASLMNRERAMRGREGAGPLANQMRDEEVRVLGERTRSMTETGRKASNFIFAGSILALLLALVALQPLRPSVAQRLTRRLSTTLFSSSPELHLTTNEELRHAGDRLERLQQVIAALNGPVTGAQVAQALLTRGARPLVASLGLVAVHDGGTFAAMHVLGDTTPPLGPGSAIPASMTPPMVDAVRTRDSVVIETRAERLARYTTLGRFSDTGTSDAAFVVAPLLGGDAVHGVLLLAFSDNRGFSDDERAYIATLGRLGGEALARALADGGRRATH